MFAIRDEVASDVPAREALLDRCFGPSRFAKTCERLRAGRLPAQGLALSAEDGGGALAGTVRLWDVAAERGAGLLMLGPVAVDPDRHGQGLGSRLMRVALRRAAALGHGAVVLVGDEPYYRRFGFTADRVSNLALPGPWEVGRFLGHDLVPGTLASAAGVLRPTGQATAALAKDRDEVRRRAA